VIQSGRGEPWTKMYANETRGLAMLLDAKSPSPQKLALEQFRYGGYTPKGLAFLPFGLLGAPGVKLWNGIAAGLRKVSPRKRAAKQPDELGHRSYFQSLVEKRWH